MIVPWTFVHSLRQFDVLTYLSDILLELEARTISKRLAFVLEEYQTIKKSVELSIKDGLISCLLLQ